MRLTKTSRSIARKQLTDGLRNRWIWMVSGLLATSVLVIAFFGAVPVGVAGAHGGAIIIASLMNLCVYLVPLLALILGCGAIIDEKQSGTLDLILVYPVSSAEYFAGTFVGYALALSVAVISGFGLSGIVLAVMSDVNVVAYMALTGLALVLGIVFLALSFFVSLVSRDRGRAVVSSVFVWICSVLVFDLVLIGVLVVSQGNVPVKLFSALLLFNPTDAFRILCFTWIEGVAAPLGLSAVMPEAASGLVPALALVLWAALPLYSCYLLFKKRAAEDTLA